MMVTSEPHPVKGPLGVSQCHYGRGTKPDSKLDHPARSQTRVWLSYVTDHEEKTCFGQLSLWNCLRRKIYLLVVYLAMLSAARTG
jgi:hypothetical protein